MMVCKRAARLFAGGALLSIFLAAGCASPPMTARLREAPPPLSAVVELDHTPFFAQERFQCGPAALATLLSANGLSVEPQALTPEVYLPEREGSLQLELIAASRRRGQVPYVLAPRLKDLLTEVQAGHPVLVLQNLALSWYPRWHYAVVVGYDLHHGSLVMRSGTERRHVVDMGVFERTWARGKHWAMVALPPDRIPASAEEFPFLKSVAALETLGNVHAAHAGYRSAVTRWPHSLIGWMGLGNSAFDLGVPAQAEAAYRQALTISPDYPPALNNVADLLAHRGDLEEAETLATRAVEIDKGHSPIFSQTLAEIRAMRRKK